MAATGEFVILHTTVGSDEEADRIAGALVTERLAACVQIVPIRSVYRWKGNEERSDELLLTVKTTGRLSDRVAERIGQLHSYEVPEIVMTPIIGGSEAYLGWIDGQTSAH